MASESRFHHLSESDFTSLAAAEYTSATISNLRWAEFSRNALLLEAIRRAVYRSGPAMARSAVESAIQLLSRVQLHSREVVTDVLTSPHFGSWAADCLIRLQNTSRKGVTPSGPTPSELGHVGTFAIVAALKSGQPFDLTVPARDGMVSLPSLGSMRADGSPGGEWRRLRSGQIGSKAIRLAPRLRARSGGLSLDLLMENSDTLLTRLGPVSRHIKPPLAEWRRCLQDAWAILVRHHRPVAEALAAGLTTLIPLAEFEAGRPISAASGWAWGAIALSLPPDPLALAETLIHEFQHLVLAAVEDIQPLVHDEAGQLCYAPWRDDPRPLSSLLQGSYAFLGVTGFWRRQRHVGTPEERERASVSFALRRRDIHRILTVLAQSAALTELGHPFVNGMRSRIRPWLAEPVPEVAEAAAREIDARHRLRWRLGNVHPDGDIIDSLARAWLEKRPPGRWPDPSSDFSKSSMQTLLSGDRAPGHAPAVAATGLADYERAVQRYLGRLSAASDPDAWTELMLALRRLGRYGFHPSAWPPIEVVVAVCERIRALIGNVPDVEAVIAWLAST